MIKPFWTLHIIRNELRGSETIYTVTLACWLGFFRRAADLPDVPLDNSVCA